MVCEAADTITDPALLFTLLDGAVLVDFAILVLRL